MPMILTNQMLIKEINLTFYSYQTQLLNMEKDNILQTLHTLKEQSSSQYNHLSNLSYQEYSYQTVNQIYLKYIQSITRCHELKQNSSKIVTKLVAESNSIFNSILSCGAQVCQLLDNKSTKGNEGQNLLISHTHYTSEAILLAFYLKRHGYHVRVLGNRAQMYRGWINSIVYKTESDKKTEFFSLLKQEGIGLTLFENSQDVVNVEKSSDLITILDIFNMHPTEYRGYLWKEVMENTSSIVYCSDIQQPEVSEMMEKIRDKKPFKLTEYGQRFPIQIIEKTKIEDQLLAFLNSELFNPTKQDIIVFHPTKSDFVHYLTQILKKHQLQSITQINYITGPNQTQKFGFSHTLGATQVNQYNNIFVAPNYDTLISWNYDLTRTFYVFDYQKDQTFSYNYRDMCYNQSYYDFITLREYMLRLSIVGINGIGKYCFPTGSNINYNKADYWYLQDRKTIDIGKYCLEMLNLEVNYEHFKDQMNHGNTKDCLQALEYAKIINKEKGVYKILRNDVLEVLSVYQTMNPILLSTILDHKANMYLQSNTFDPEKQKYSRIAHLLAISAGILMTPQNLRRIPAKTNNIIDRPSPLWRQTGYLHSAIDAVVRYKIIENRNNAMSLHPNHSKRLSSRPSLQNANSLDYDMFGTLFDVLQPSRLTFDEMKEEDFIREEFICETALYKIIGIYQMLCEVLGLEQIEFKKFQQINEIIQALLKKVDKGYGIYSGSRREGYLMKSKVSGLFANKNSLLALLNERPHFLYILRIFQTITEDGSNKQEIQMCNSITSQQFMSIFGNLPSHKQSSYGEHQLQFHGISSATFVMLNRNNGLNVQAFENKYSCMMEFNEEIDMIMIYCAKENSKIIQEEFQKILNKIKTDLVANTKIMNYYGNTGIILGSGGATVQAVKDTLINKCLLSNLHVDVEQEDLYDVFDEFFTLKSINLERAESQTIEVASKIATIQFMSQRDYYRFYEYYNGCLLMGQKMEVNPIKQTSLKTVLSQEMYIQFRWFVWKSQSEAVVEFQNEEIAKQCELAMKSRKINNTCVKASVKQNKVYFENLHKYTDEISIESALKDLGKINHIQMLRLPSKEKQEQQDQLVSIIKNTQKEAIQFDVKPIKKLKNGLRKCVVTFQDVKHINTILNELNGKVGILGTGKLHLFSWFTNPVIIPKGYSTLYEDLMSQALSKMPDNHCIVIEHEIFMQNQFIVTKSAKKQEIDVFKQKINEVFTGYPVEITQSEGDILLTEIGIQNLFELEQKHNCKLLPDFKNKKLQVLVKAANIQRIREEIKAKVNDKFFYRIPLNIRAFKHLKENPDVYKCMETQYQLSLLELQEIGRNILIEGKAHHVQQAFNYLMHAIESISKPMEEMVNADCCGICCQEPFRPYRLQQCGHKFCLQCLIDNVESTLGDISMFPIKCPQCLAEFVIDDLNNILDNKLWPKLITMSVNQYVGKNPQIITNCYTPGCKQINFYGASSFKCDICNKGYCVLCKSQYHPGLTCKQAKEGTDKLFEKYMKQNNVRRCAYEKCKMPIFRTDGCYRVTCNQCGKSMCFKCEPNKMTPYDNYMDCYKHLEQVHGDYW